MKRNRGHENLTGRRFGRWTVLGEAPAETIRGVHWFRWFCRCDCGEERIVAGHYLRYKGSRSCGCLVQDSRFKKHGEAGRNGKPGSVRYELWRGAKARAKQLGLPFDLSLDDVRVPDLCPILGIPLAVNVGGKAGCPNSPSLDRVIPSRGYIQGNVRVISHRANTLKNDGTLEEFRAILRYMEKCQ